MKTIRILCLALPLAAAAPHALAQPFKCKGPDGKVVYSDQRCPTDDGKAKGAPAPVAPAGPSAEQKERIATLEALTKDAKATDDQKWAARLEINAIRSGAEARFTAEERKKRDALVAELGGTDKKRRSAALDELRWFYNR